jgi:hypothetical protein
METWRSNASVPMVVSVSDDETDVESDDEQEVENPESEEHLQYLEETHFQINKYVIMFMQHYQQ